MASQEYINKAISGAMGDFHSAAGPSHINDPLFKSACRMYQFVNAGWISESDAEQQLTDAARALGHADQSIRDTLKSARRATAGQKAEEPKELEPRDTFTITPTKGAYSSLEAYEAERGAIGAFAAAGWTEDYLYEYEYIDKRGNRQRALTNEKPSKFVAIRRALRFPTQSGPRWRLIDGLEGAKYWHPRGTHLDSNKSWYRLPEALQIAYGTNQPLVLTNGEPSVVAAQFHGVPATSLTGGGERPIPDRLLKELLVVWPGEFIVALDCDAKGRKAAGKLVQQLRDVGRKARAVDLGLGETQDLANFCAIHNGTSAQALQSLPELQLTSPTAAKSDSTILLTANLTDAGNAECLEHLYGSSLRYNRTQKFWLIWNGQCWQGNADSSAYRAALDTVRQRYLAAPQLDSIEARQRLAKHALSSEQNKSINATLNVAKNLVSFDTSEELYDANPFLAGCKNGTLNLETCQLQQAKQEDYITKQFGAAYDPTATAPRWTQFLNEIFNNDQELISYVQRAVGYSLTGDTREQKMFLLHGGGANGKSLFLDILRDLLGGYAATAAFETFDAARKNSIGEDLAALKGSRFVSVIETNEDRRLDEARVKSVTGQDPITCRFLHANLFTYRPTYKIWLAMNHKPVIRGTDRGIWRRIRLIPFTASFEGREDMLLKSKLTAELSGILNWALEGLRQWQKSGLGTAAVVEQAVEEYKSESDQLGRWLDENVICEAGSRVTASKLYADYKDWCAEAGERYPLTQNAWGRQLTERGFAKTSYKPTSYLGIRLRSLQDQPTAQLSDKDLNVN